MQYAVRSTVKISGSDTYFHGWVPSRVRWKSFTTTVAKCLILGFTLGIDSFGPIPMDLAMLNHGYISMWELPRSIHGCFVLK